MVLLHSSILKNPFHSYNYKIYPTSGCNLIPALAQENKVNNPRGVSLIVGRLLLLRDNTFKGLSSLLYIYIPTSSYVHFSNITHYTGIRVVITVFGLLKSI
jgi:hypothetical protein